MRTILIILIGLLTMTASSSNSEKEKPMEKCYCEYCGKQFPDVRQLVSAPCAYHPDGPNRESISYTKDVPRLLSPANIAATNSHLSCRW